MDTHIQWTPLLLEDFIINGYTGATVRRECKQIFSRVIFHSLRVWFKGRQKKNGCSEFVSLSMLGTHILHTCIGEQDYVLLKTSLRAILFHSHLNLSASRCQSSFEGLVPPSPISVLIARYLVGGAAQPWDVGNGSYLLGWSQHEWPGAGEIKDPGLFLTSTRCCMHSLLSLSHPEHLSGCYPCPCAKLQR